MIVDLIDNSRQYFKTYRGFAEAFQFIQEYKDKKFEPQRIHLDGPNLIAIIEAADGRGRAGARLEAHRKYIDIQYTFEGNEEIGWKPFTECQEVSQPYDKEKDITFFSDLPKIWIPLPRNSFAIFFPEDAHAPLAAQKPVRKIIMKVAMEQNV